MSSRTETAIDARFSNPLDVVPDEIPFDVPYGPPVSLDQAQVVIHAAVAEAKKRNWKMNIAVADSGGNLVAFQRMDGAMLASIQIAENKARAAATFRRPTKVFEDGIQLMHLNYLLAFDGVIASRGGIPLIELRLLIEPPQIRMLAVIVMTEEGGVPDVDLMPALHWGPPQRHSGMMIARDAACAQGRAFAPRLEAPESAV